MARAVGLQKRADGLLVRAGDPHTRDEIALVALAARDAQSWLVEIGAAEVERLREIEASLRAQSKKLDDLEDLGGGR